MNPTDPPNSISAALELQLQTRPDSICMVFLPGNEVTQEITCRQLQAAIYHYAHVLRAQGIIPGDLVALVFNHTWELIPAFLGAVHLGVVPVILPYLNTISGERLEKRVKQMIAAWQVRAVVTLPHYLPALDFLETAGCPITALPAPNETGVEAVPVCGRGGGEAAYLQLSSGTTGEPKATIIPHRALLNSIQTMIEAWSLTEQDVSVGWLPLHHDMGLIFQVLTPLLGGFLSVLIAPDYWVRRPRSLMQAVHHYRGTWTGMPNFAFNHCVHAIRESDMTGLDLSSWRLLLNGAELIYLNSLQMFYDRFAPYGLRHECLRAVYGMTENVGAISLTPPVSVAKLWLVDWVATADLVGGGNARPMPSHHPEARPIVNCGRLLPGNELKIAAADGSALPDRQVGEVWLRSHSLCPGYYRLENGHIPQDGGWFPTGDIGYLVNGELFICDRKKDIIISAGNHIFPGVIEPVGVEILGDRAGSMAAFGVSSAELGTELPVLVGEVRGKIDEADRIGWMAAIRRQVHRELGITLADIRLVRRGWLVQTTSAKIARAACRQKYLDEFAPAGLEAGPQTATSKAARPQLDTPFVPPRTNLEQQLADIWAELLGLDEVGVNDDFFELGGDSLLAMRLVLLVEQRLGWVLPTGFFQQATILNLCRVMQPGQNLPAAETGETTAAWGNRRPNHPPRLHRATSLLHRPPTPLRTARWLRRKFKNLLFAGNCEQVRHRLRWWSFWAAGRMYAADLALLAQMQTALGGGSLLSLETKRAYLTGNILMRQWWQLERLGTGDTQEDVLGRTTKPFWRDLWQIMTAGNPAQTEAAFSFSGGEHFEAALQRGRGVILLSYHSPGLPFTGPVISRQWNCGPIIAAVQVGGNRKTSLTPTEQSLTIERTVQAYRSLQAGGVIRFVNDNGYIRQGTITCNVAGKSYDFKSGFAEMAWSTGAAIVPQFAFCQPDGHIHATFAPALPLPATAANQTEYAHRMIEHYAAFLTSSWRASPASLQVGVIQRHFAQPVF